MSTTLDLQNDTGAAILNRVIQPDDVAMTPDAARTLLSFKFAKQTLKHHKPD